MPRQPRRKPRLAAARERMYRDLVFESAEHVFADRGFGAATMQDIAREAGVSLKTVYLAYPGKRELYAEIHATRGREFVEQVRGALDGGGSPLDALDRGVRAYVDFLVHHADFLRIHLREGRAWSLPPSGIGQPFWKDGVAGFVSVLERGMRDGTFHRGDPELLAMMGIAIMQVPLARRAHGIAEADAAALADEILLPLRRLLCSDDASA